MPCSLPKWVSCHEQQISGISNDSICSPCVKIRFESVLVPKKKSDLEVTLFSTCFLHVHIWSRINFAVQLLRHFDCLSTNVLLSNTFVLSNILQFVNIYHIPRHPLASGIQIHHRPSSASVVRALTNWIWMAKMNPHLFDWGWILDSSVNSSKPDSRFQFEIREIFEDYHVYTKFFVCQN